MLALRRPFAVLLAVTCAAGAGSGCGSDSGGRVDTSEATAADVAAGAKAQDAIAAQDEKDAKAKDELLARQAAIDASEEAKPATTDDDAVEPATPAAPAPEAKPEPRPAATRSKALLSDADRASFARLASQLGGTSGIAVVRTGRGGTPTGAGSLTSGVAWSTMKTGVAAATYARGAGGASSDLLRSAITASDNAAAEQLWSRLGGPAQAGSLVQAQLRAAGDTSTAVQTRRVRAGFTAFGQTQWTLKDQARFTAVLPCTSGGKQLLELMGQVVGGQRWGLGSAGVPARFKGGWGPGAGGGYLVRQMGILTIKGRPVAITIATLPGDGSFEGGQRNLTAIARWAVTHVGTRGVPASPSC